MTINLEFTYWELQALTSAVHEYRNGLEGNASKMMLNRANALFDKVRFAEFNNRPNKEK